MNAKAVNKEARSKRRLITSPPPSTVWAWCCIASAAAVRENAESRCEVSQSCSKAEQQGRERESKR